MDFQGLVPSRTQAHQGVLFPTVGTMIDSNLLLDALNAAQHMECNGSLDSISSFSDAENLEPDAQMAEVSFTSSPERTPPWTPASLCRYQRGQITAELFAEDGVQDLFEREASASGALLPFTPPPSIRKPSAALETLVRCDGGSSLQMLSSSTAPMSATFISSSSSTALDVSDKLSKCAAPPPRKRRNTTAGRTESVHDKGQVKPPRGHLRYRDRLEAPIAASSTGSSKSSATPPSIAGDSAVSPPHAPSDGPIKMVSLSNIDRSKCLTLEQILGYDPKQPPRSLAAISCAIEDEQLNPRAQADLEASRRRLCVPENLVRPPENAVTNVVTADMRPEQAEEAIKWSKVAMREAKQTQAMLMYAMDHADFRRQSKVTFALPGEQVYTAFVGGSGSGAPGGESSNSTSGLVSALRGGRAHTDEGHRSTTRVDSLGSDGTASGSSSGGTFSSGRPSISSSDASDGIPSGFTLLHNVAPPVPAYTFSMPNFQLRNSDATPDASAMAPNYVPYTTDATGTQGMPWDAALQTQAVNMLNSFQLPNGDTSAGPAVPLAFPHAAGAGMPTISEVNTLATLSFTPLQAGSTNDALATVLPLSNVPSVSGLATSQSEATLLARTDFSNNLNGLPRRQRAITATGIERLLGSATIADHSRSMPEPAMNPCALYPPGHLIGYQQWVEQQRFIGMIGAEPQLLPPSATVPMPVAEEGVNAPSMPLGNPAATQAQVVGATVNVDSVPAASASAAVASSSPATGKRKSVEDHTESEGWTSAYPPPLPGGRGTKKRGRPRSRSDVPPKPKPSAALSAALKQKSGADSEAVGVMHGPELPPGVKKDVPIAAPSRVPLRICAPIARRGVGKTTSQASSSASGGASASPSGSTSSVQTQVQMQMQMSTPVLGTPSSMSSVLGGMLPPSSSASADVSFDAGLGLTFDGGHISSTSTTPRPMMQNRLRAATTSALPTATLADAMLSMPAMAGPSMEGSQVMAMTAPAPAPALMALPSQGMPSPLARPTPTNRVRADSSRSSTSSRSSVAGSSSLRPATSTPVLPAAPSSSSTAGGSAAAESGGGDGEILFVTYGMEDAHELRQGVAPSGNYKVPLHAKRRKMT